MSDGYEFHEYRPGKFVKIENGTVTTWVLEAEVIWDKMKQDTSIEAGIIEVSIALTALSGFMFTLISETNAKALLGLGFLLFASSTFLLFIPYLFARLPLISIEYIDKKGKMVLNKPFSLISFWVFALIIWPIKAFNPKKKIIKYSNYSPFSIHKEMGLVALFWGILLSVGAAFPLILEQINNS